MPEKKTVQKAKQDLKQGKSPSTAAGELVHEEIEHVRQGKHGARSAKQAVAVGLSKARRAGVPLPAPKRGQASARTRRAAERDVEVGQGTRKPRPATKRRQAATRALKRESSAAASKPALSRQAKSAATRRRTKKAAPAAAGTRTARRQSSARTTRPRKAAPSPRRPRQPTAATE